MKTRSALSKLAPGLLLLLPGILLAAETPSRLLGSKPNIIFILTDDQGYGDASAHGNPVLKTPNLDRLHAESVRFTDFQVSPTCAPTRSALLTGRHEFKNGVTHTILERERLTLNATTLAQVLKSAGYATGIFGKWHLGDEAEYQPGRRGFDETFIHGAGGIGQTYPGSCGDAPGNTYFNPAILHNGKFEKTKGFCTDVFFGQALRWMESVKGDCPFLAWISPNAPHAPYTARPEDAALYRDRVANEDTANFLGMVHNIDENVGRLLARLEEWSLATNTLVVFMNDNGGTAGTRVFNAGMRGAKGTAFFGGTRAISFWRWTGRIRPEDCGALTSHIDVFPTLSELAGAALTPQVSRQVEGRSLLPLIADPTADWPERTLITHLGRWQKGVDPNTSKYKMCSVRTLRWHMVSADGGSDPRWMLFDMAHDRGQEKDLAGENPEVVQKMALTFDDWWTKVQPMLVNEAAVGPAINPFKKLFYDQFGGKPSPEELRQMDPNREMNPGKAKKNGKARTRS